MPIPRTDEDTELSSTERARRLARRATTTTSVNARTASSEEGTTTRRRRRNANFRERIRRTVANQLRRVARRFR